MKNVGVKRTPLACELATSASTRSRARVSSAVGDFGRVLAEPQIVGHRTQVFFGQRARAGHQRNVRAPEFVGRSRLFHELRGAAGQLTTRDRTVTEYVSNTIAELLADFADSRIGGAAMRAVIAAVFDQRDFGARRVPRCGRVPDRRRGLGDCSWQQLEHVESLSLPRGWLSHGFRARTSACKKSGLRIRALCPVRGRHSRHTGARIAVHAHLLRRRHGRGERGSGPALVGSGLAHAAMPSRACSPWPSV